MALSGVMRLCGTAGHYTDTHLNGIWQGGIWATYQGLVQADDSALDSPINTWNKNRSLSNIHEPYLKVADTCDYSVVLKTGLGQFGARDSVFVAPQN